MKAIVMTLAALASVVDPGCNDPPTPDQKVAAAQSQALTEANKQVGLPAITHWQEMRMAKDIYELRDKAIATHTYIVNEMAGCLVYLGPSVGYGLPYATQYSSPEHDIYYDTSSTVHHNMPQAEPNGLFMPGAAEGTWIMMKDPNSEETKPVYVEPRVLVSPFRLEAQECVKPKVASSK